jgi:F-box/leucine-rich repeat protein 2/20
MDLILCDELILEIFHRLPRRPSTTVALVSRRWLRLHRLSKTTLSLKILSPNSSLPLLSSYLSYYPYLSSLSVTTAADGGGDGFSERFILSVALSCSNLKSLRYFSCPVSISSLISLSHSCSQLCSLSVSISRHVSLRWLVCFLSLKQLSINFTTINNGEGFFYGEETETLSFELQLESLSLCGIRSGDHALNLLWRNCKKVKKLKLQSCESLGDNASFSSFLKNPEGLEQVELRTCRSIIDYVLQNLEFCKHLNSLLIHDGGSSQGLLQFITRSRCNIRNLDLRLPLDLDDTHLSSIAENFTGLSTLRLRSSSLITDEGLRTISSALSNTIQDLSLMNCDAVGRHTGLLAALGQNLKKLNILNLSYNEKLVDKEFASMMISCHTLRELKLRGCNKLSNAAFSTIPMICKNLESIDIMDCCMIDEYGIENFVMNSRRLTRVEVEESKISDKLKVFAAINSIEIGC